MEETSSRKCENCGGALEVLNAETLKCPYCGCTYSIKQPAAAAPTGPQAGPAGLPESKSNVPGSKYGGAIVAVFFIIVLVIVILIAAAHQAHTGGMSNSSTGR